MPTLYITGNAEADALLSADANALLIGMLLDQQVLIEVAFAGPATIARRMGSLDVARIAGMDPEEFAALCAERPAIHRFPKAMAERIQTLCRTLVDEWDGDGGRMLRSAPTGADLHRLVASLPGFGATKASIFVALLGKQYDIAPPGWREAAGEFGVEGSHWSVADIADPESLALVRANKKAAKAAAKAAKA